MLLYIVVIIGDVLPFVSSITTVFIFFNLVFNPLKCVNGATLGLDSSVVVKVVNFSKLPFISLVTRKP